MSTNTDLIAEARVVWEADDLYPDQIIPRLVKALEATVKEMHARELHHFEEEERAAGLAAVIERAEDFVTRHYLDTQMGQAVLTELSTPLGDALREVKADVWDEGYFRRMEDYPFDPEERDNPYRQEQP